MITNSHPPNFSIVVPVLNGSHTISTCLQSLVSQNYPSNLFEIIVVDNGSTDNTRDIVASFPVSLLTCPTRGPAAARNYGITQCSHEIIAFTDADCIASPTWLLELAKFYSDPTIGGVGGNIKAYEHASLTDYERFSSHHTPLKNFISGEGEYLPHLYTANASFRKELLDRVGGFNPRMVTGEDVDLSWRIQLETGAKLAFAPDAVVYHYHRSTRKGLTRQYRQYGFGEILIDTMYSSYPKYPRNLRFQIIRILKQILALPTYLISILWRFVKKNLKLIDRFEAMLPALWFLIEVSNIIGKIDGLIATRFMTNSRPALNINPEKLVQRYFQLKKE